MTKAEFKKQLEKYHAATLEQHAAHRVIAPVIQQAAVLKHKLDVYDPEKPPPYSPDLRIIGSSGLVTVNYDGEAKVGIARFFTGVDAPDDYVDVVVPLSFLLEAAEHPGNIAEELDRAFKACQKRLRQNAEKARKEADARTANVSKRLERNERAQLRRLLKKYPDVARKKR